jgi:hypothetical protein
VKNHTSKHLFEAQYAETTQIRGQEAWETLFLSSLPSEKPTLGRNSDSPTASAKSIIPVTSWVQIFSKVPHSPPGTTSSCPTSNVASIYNPLALCFNFFLAREIPRWLMVEGSHYSVAHHHRWNPQILVENVAGSSTYFSTALGSVITVVRGG